MPGSSYGGAGEVIAYDQAANVVFRKKIQSTFSEIEISDTNIYIPGDGTYEFKKKK